MFITRHALSCQKQREITKGLILRRAVYSCHCTETLTAVESIQKLRRQLSVRVSPPQNGKGHRDNYFYVLGCG